MLPSSRDLDSQSHQNTGLNPHDPLALDPCAVDDQRRRRNAAFGKRNETSVAVRSADLPGQAIPLRGISELLAFIAARRGGAAGAGLGAVAVAAAVEIVEQLAHLFR